MFGRSMYSGRLILSALVVLLTVSLAGHAASPALAGPPACRVGQSSNCESPATNAAETARPQLAVVGPITVGSYPSGIAIDEATNTVYVATEGNNSISVIDGASNVVNATITTGAKQLDGLAINRSTNTLYATDYATNTLYVISAATNSVTATVPVGANPNAVAVDEATNTIYVANHGGSVSVIDGAQPTATPTTISVPGAPWAIAVDATTDMIYVANRDANTVAVINGANNQVVATISVGKTPLGIAVDATTDTIDVANAGNGSVSVIDGSTNTVMATTTIGGFNEGVAVDTASNTIYSTNIFTNSVTVIDGVTDSITATIAAGSGASTVAVDQSSHTVYVANYYAGSITVINGINPDPGAVTIPVGGHPQAIAVNQTTNTIYAGNFDNNNVSVIDGNTNRVVATVSAGSAPKAIGVNEATNMIYVVNYFSNNVSVINGANLAATPVSITVGNYPLAVAVDQTRNLIYVANNSDSSISVINGATNTVTSTITLPTGSYPAALAIDTARNRLYVASDASGAVLVIDLTNPGATPSSIAINGASAGIAIDPSTGMAYVAIFSNNTVSAINLATQTIVTTITVGNDPGELVVDPATDLIYVPNALSNNISVIDDRTNSVVATLAAGADQLVLALDTATDTIYAASNSGGVVDVIKGVTPPGAPQNVTATAGNGQATVRWQPPAFDGGVPIISYIVTPSPATVAPITVQAPEQTATLTGLTNGTSYTFTVTAINGIGSSLPSMPSSAVTPTAPAPLPDAAASTFSVSPPSVPADGKTPATLTVTLLDASGHPVTGKSVTLTPSGGSAVLSAPSGASNSSGIVSFTVTDATAELVAFSAMDSTDGVKLSQQAAVAFTQPCTSCSVTLAPTGERATPGGGSVTANVVVQAPPSGLGHWTINVAYDPTLLQPAGCSSTNSQCDTRFAPGVVQVTGQASTPLTGSQTLAQVSFTAFGSTAANSQVTATALVFTDAAGVPQTATTTSLLVVVGKQGDVNLDGSVTAVDALCVLRTVAGLPQTDACPQNPSTHVMADVNGDGSVTSVDALCVLRLVAGLPPTNACPSLVGIGSRESGGGSRAAIVSTQPSALSPRSSSSSPPSLLGTGAGGLGNALSLSPSTVSTANGKQTTVEVTFDASRPLGAWTIDLHYDPAVVKVVSCTPSAGSLCNARYARGVVRIVGAAASGLSGSAASGGLATLVFEGLGPGQKSAGLSISPVTLTGTSGASLSLAP